MVAAAPSTKPKQPKTKDAGASRAPKLGKFWTGAQSPDGTRLLYVDPRGKSLKLPERLRTRTRSWVRAPTTLRRREADRPPQVVQAPPARSPRLLTRGALQGGASYTPESALLASQLQVIGNAASAVPPGAFLWELIWPKGPQGLPVHNPDGKYAVRVCVFGKWRLLVIDDLVPVDASGHCLFPHSMKNDELWPLLLSKAVFTLQYLFPTATPLPAPRPTPHGAGSGERTAVGSPVRGPKWIDSSAAAVFRWLTGCVVEARALGRHASRGAPSFAQSSFGSFFGSNGGQADVLGSLRRCWQPQPAGAAEQPEEGEEFSEAGGRRVVVLMSKRQSKGSAHSVHAQRVYSVAALSRQSGKGSGKGGTVGLCGDLDYRVWRGALRREFERIASDIFVERKLTQAELQADVKKTFDRFDADGSGAIDRDEVRLILVEKMGEAWCTSEALDKVFDVMDTDGDGEIDFQEFTRWYLGPEARSALHARKRAVARQNRQKQEEQRRKGKGKGKDRSKGKLGRASAKAAAMSALSASTTFVLFAFY